jgi:hypothetical protein
MNQGTRGYCLPKKTEGRKSRETVPLKQKIGEKKMQNPSQTEKVGVIHFPNTECNLKNITI